MGDYHSDGGGGRDKTRGLFELYQDEKKAEARTRQKIHELQDNSDRVLQCKLRVIEKLLDVKVKDELAMLRKSANVAVVESDNALVRRRASERLLREVDAVVPAARDRYPDSFVTHFQSLSAVHDADLREGIRKDVQEQLDGELRPLLLRRTAAQAEQPSRVDAVDRETEGVILAGQRALLEGTTEARAASHQDRVRRVREAEAKLLRPADFTPAALAELMACVPTGHGYDTGLLEAEINDLRTLIYKQRGEEEKLLLERSAQLATLEEEEGALLAEVRGLQNELTGLVEETEEKKAEAAEMRAALEPGVGRWDVEVEAARESLESLREEHLKMKRDYAELSKQVDTVDSDRRLLTDAFHEEVEDLSGLQDRYRQVVDQIEEQLFRFKEDILAVRGEDLANTRRINELRWKASHGGEQRADTKRAFKECLNQSIGQMAIEELLQIVIQSKIVHLEEDASLLRTRWNEKLTEERTEAQRCKQQTAKTAEALDVAIQELSNLRTGMQAGVSQGRPAHSAQHIRQQIHERMQQWNAVVWDTAEQVAATRAKILYTEEENQIILDTMGHIVVMGRTLDAEGLDVEASPTPQLAATANRMYDDLTAASHRETKLSQLLRVFRDMEEHRARGENIPQLTGKRHLSRAERRARRSIQENAWLAKEIAKQNVSLQSAFPITEQPVTATDPARDPGGEPSQEPTADHAHKLRVVNFIKAEIQPLYDTRQIPRRRFIDIVSRVSSAFLESHPVTPALVEGDKVWLQSKIQEVIDLQDAARSRRKADRSVLRG